MSLPLFPDPIAVFQNIASPVDVSVSLASVDFGPNAVVNMITTVTLKLTGEPVPYLPLDILLNGQTFKQRLTTDTKGVISQKVTLTDEGTYVFEALPSDLESFQSTFGPFIPKGSQTLTIYALTFQAFNSGLGKEMNVGLTVSGRSFQTPAKILSPQMHLSVAYPQIAQGVYSLDPNQLELDVRGDEAVIVRYNAPGAIVANLSFDGSCIPGGGSMAGSIRGTVNDVGGHPFPGIPVSVNGTGTQTDSGGNFSQAITATNPGTQSVTVKTLTPVSVSQTFQQVLPECTSTVLVTDIENNYNNLVISLTYYNNGLKGLNVWIDAPAPPGVQVLLHSSDDSRVLVPVWQLRGTSLDSVYQSYLDQVKASINGTVKNIKYDESQGASLPAGWMPTYPAYFTDGTYGLPATLAQAQIVVAQGGV